MRLLADLHIAPRTVQFLRTLRYNVLQVTDMLPATASDETIVEDFDVTTIIALSRR